MEEKEWRMTIDDERKKEDRRGDVDLYMIGVVVGTCVYSVRSIPNDQTGIEPIQCCQFQTIKWGLFMLAVVGLIGQSFLLLPS